jgi:hypothetical protein
MKYYLVSYIILDNKTITENGKTAICLHGFACIEALRKSIAAQNKIGYNTDNIVIKSYKQVTREAFSLFIDSHE